MCSSARALVFGLGLLVAARDGRAGDVPLLYVDGLRPAHDSYLRECAKDLGDPDPHKRRAAAQALADAGDAGVSVLLDTFAKTQNGIVLRSALLALGESETGAAVSELRRMLDKGGEKGGLQDGERAVLGLVLGIVGPGSAGDALRGEAGSKRPSMARLCAVLALGRAADGEGLSAMLAGIAKEPIEEQRAAVVLALGEAMARGAHAPAGALIAALRDKGALVRRAAALALALVPDAGSAAALEDAWKREKDLHVKVCLALALGRIDDAQARDVLTQAARGRAGDVRDTALVALAEHHGGALADVIKSVKDSSVLETIALACAGNTNAAPTQALVGWLDAPQPGLRSAAGLALAALDANAGRDAVLEWAAREADADALEDALLAVAILDVPAALDRVGALSAHGGRCVIANDVRKTLEHRRDVRLLDAVLEKRLRARRARALDRVRIEVALLVDEILDLDDIARRLPTSETPTAPASGDDGGSTGGDGSGDGGTDDGGGEGSGGEGSTPTTVTKKAPRVDPRNSSLERDLAEWFRERPYFEDS